MYKEIWIPGFNINEENCASKDFLGGKINGRTIIKVLLYANKLD